jgi:hypothetical protein
LRSANRHPCRDLPHRQRGPQDRKIAMWAVIVIGAGAGLLALYYILYVQSAVIAARSNAFGSITVGGLVCMSPTLGAP